MGSQSYLQFRHFWIIKTPPWLSQSPNLDLDISVVFSLTPNPLWKFSPSFHFFVMPPLIFCIILSMLCIISAWLQNHQGYHDHQQEYHLWPPGDHHYHCCLPDKLLSWGQLCLCCWLWFRHSISGKLVWSNAQLSQQPVDHTLFFFISQI